MPFFFIIWGVTLAEAIPIAGQLFSEIAKRFTKLTPMFRNQKKVFEYGILALVTLFVVASNSAYPRSLIFIFSGDPRVHWNAEGWAKSASLLRPLMDEVDIVATSNGLFALYYLGRYDIVISPSKVAESSTEQEFGRDLRTGSYAISTPESLELIMSCFNSGIFISDSVWRWRKPNVGISDEMADFLNSQTEAIDLPQEWMLRAFRWDRPEELSIPNDCPNMPGLIPRSADNDT
jgi:hypothetical protein